MSTNPTAPDLNTFGLSGIRKHHIIALTRAQERAMRRAQMLVSSPGESQSAEQLGIALGELGVKLHEALTAHLVEIRLKDRHDVTVIPGDLLDGITAYIEQRRETGGFLRAVLENNLILAVARADDISVRVLPQLVSYLHNAEHIPGASWGSEAKVAAWLDAFANRNAPEVTDEEKAEQRLASNGVAG